ncbi:MULTISPECIES: PKD domain-containing protein [Chitinophagaceae]
MKFLRFIIIVALLCVANVLPLFAHHIKGGWIGYECIPALSSSTTSTYKITAYVYIDCHNSEGSRDSIVLGIFDAGTNTQTTQIGIRTNGNDTLQKTSFSPCIINRPDVCYNVYSYTTTVTLPNNESGYNLNIQFRARVDNIVNIVNSGNTGITLFTSIPGSFSANNGKSMDAHINSSPAFNFQDTSIVCHNSKISIPFSATDPDGDSLSYAFGPGNDASGSNNIVIVPPTPLPYPELVYTFPFSGAAPLGANVTIDPKTGIISGTAPDVTGEYVVAVYVQEWRHGTLINTTKKELQINVTDCSLQSATLNPSYINCKDFTFTFKNNTTTTTAAYLWDFGVVDGKDNTSTDPSPTFTYPKIGTYKLKLKVGVSEECMDSTTAEVNVYPGFFPGFTMKGNCILNGSSFSDTTKTSNGTVNSWQWDFGDNTTTATTQNPTHQFQQPGNYKVLLQVGNSKGCSDTVSHTLTIFNKLNVQPLFTDTTICYKDSVQLVVAAPFAQTYQWTSTSTDISDPTVSNPIVYPKENIQYTLTVKNEDCIDNIKVNVNILKDIHILADDLYACIGDSATFNVASQASKYTWTSISGNDALSNYTSTQPSLLVSGNNSYHIVATYGAHCIAEKDVNVLAAPYPILKIANKDTSVCLGNSIQLNATGSTTDDVWLANNQSGKTIVVAPTQTTTYIIDGYDRNSYCNKHVQDSVIVKTATPFNIQVTRDTTIVLRQPLFLKPTTSFPDRHYTYTWTPTNYLDYTDSSIAVANIPIGITQQFYTVKVQDEFGCEATAQTAVHIFQTATDFFVPTAFTPNGDGKNDIIKPTLAGIRQFNYFKLYNRWGQLVYTTNTPGKGWNGYIQGHLQPSGSTFVYQVSGIDFNGQKIEKSGTVVLIR